MWDSVEAVAVADADGELVSDIWVEGDGLPTLVNAALVVEPSASRAAGLEVETTTT